MNGQTARNLAGRRKYEDKFEVVDWSATAPGRDVVRKSEHYHDLAAALLKKGLNESAYAAASKAIDLHILQSPEISPAFLGTCLRQRYMAARNLGFMKFAALNAIEAIFVEPLLGLRYIDAGNLFQAQQDHAGALYIYSRALRHIDKQDPYYYTIVLFKEACKSQLEADKQADDKTTNHKTPTEARSVQVAVDPAEKLPQEILLKIMAYLSLPERFHLMRVNRAWYRATQKYIREDLTHLDLEDFEWPLTMTELRLILDKSRNSIEEISLGLVSSGEVDICTQLILYGKYKVGDKIIAPESEPSGYRLDSLRSLKFNTVSSVFDRLMDYHFVFKQSIFGQLEELRIRIENAPTVLKYFGFSEFPRLRVLECYTGQDIVGSSTNEVAFLDSLDEAGGDRGRYNQQPQLKVLRLGLPFKISKVNEFPYYRSRASVAISPQSLQRLLRLVPELEEFSCRMVNTRRVTDRMMNVRGAGLRLNLREMTPKLKTLDLSYSELRAMPLVPATCEVIRLDYCEKMGLRACETFRGVRYYTDVLDSEGDGYFLANMPDEYLNLCTVSLVHSAVETEKLFDGLVRCDTERLTHLNLHGCDQIDFSQSLPAKSDFCKNHKRYGFFDDPSRSPLAQLVVHIFPNLEELYVGGISSVDDATLDAFTMLENLRLLEITDTNTTLRGITHVLLKENTPTTTGDLQKSLALRQFDKFRTRLVSMPIELFPLSRVIISGAVVEDWFIDVFTEVGVVIEVASNLFEGYHSSK